jgi:hypothetical protein
MRTTFGVLTEVVRGELLDAIESFGGSSRLPPIYERLQSIFPVQITLDSTENKDSQGEFKWRKSVRNRRGDLVREGLLDDS